MIINPELTTALEISKILRFPSAIKIDTFAKGRAELMKFKLKPEFGLGGMSVQDISDRLKCNILVCGVERGEEVLSPTEILSFRITTVYRSWLPQRIPLNFSAKSALSPTGSRLR